MISCPFPFARLKSPSVTKFSPWQVDLFAALIAVSMKPQFSVLLALKKAIMKDIGLVRCSLEEEIVIVETNLPSNRAVFVQITAEKWKKWTSQGHKWKNFFSSSSIYLNGIFYFRPTIKKLTLKNFPSFFWVICKRLMLKVSIIMSWLKSYS